jgi:branched-chain amino acid transport system permease protein
MVTGPEATAQARYVVALFLVALFALLAKNLVRGRVGRSWMAIRDRTSPPRSSACGRCAPSCSRSASAPFYCGWPGAELVFLFLGSAEDAGVRHQPLVPRAVHDHHRRAGDGARLVPGAAFIVMVPIFLANAPHALGLHMPVALQKQLELMVFGGLILFFLIVEPNGLARLWQITKEKLRLWPFPH